MEGALEAADRIAHTLRRSAPSTCSNTLTKDLVHTTRARAVGAFSASVLALREMAPERYRLHLIRLLSGHQSELLTQRALLATVDQVYSESLVQLDQLLPAMDASNGQISNGRHVLTAALLVPFDGWNKALLEAALHHNEASCALSNFPSEHLPHAETLRAITLDLAAAWREFALELNSRLLVASGTTELVL